VCRAGGFLGNTCILFGPQFKLFFTFF
jgi:hypothetical protein